MTLQILKQIGFDKARIRLTKIVDHCTTPITGTHGHQPVIVHDATQNKH